MNLLEAMQGLDAETLLAMPESERNALISDLDEYITYKETNKLEFFEPYPYQAKFMKQGATHNVRYMRAGNRVGKTAGGAMEFAYHITGLYPDWWEGARIEGAGHLFWCVGVDLKMVADIQQAELMGTPDCKITEDLGKGSIPRRCIELDKSKGWQADGARLERVMIKHVSGGYNTLEFYGSTNPNALMGREVVMCWIDEESIYTDKIYSQCMARITNALGIGKNGYIMITATPENGDSEINRIFANDKSGLLYMLSVTWWDCPRFTKESIEQELAKYPPWERDVRSKGIPFVGQGAVFRTDDALLMIDDIEPGDDWEVIASCDFGDTLDPTIYIVCLRNTVTDTYYVYDLFYFDQSEYDRSPKNLAQAIMSSPYRNVPLIVPPDGGDKSEANDTKAKILRRFGVNVAGTFRNPHESLMKITRGSGGASNVRRIEPGLAEMRLMMEEGRFKVTARCNEWIAEKRSYSYRHNPRTGSVDFRGADHCIDASRYAVMSLMANRGALWSERELINNFTPDYGVELLF